MKHANTDIARGPCLVPLSYSLHDKKCHKCLFSDILTVDVYDTIQVRLRRLLHVVYF